MFTLDDLAPGIKKLQDADRVVSITKKDFTTFRGIKRGEIKAIHGASRGSGKSKATQAWIDKNTDKRISAISRDGNKIEINYHSYAAENIPGLLDWMAEVGVGDYTMTGPHIIFADTIDADLFWMTFVGIQANRFFQMNNTNNFGAAQEDIKVAQRQALDGGAPVVLRLDNGEQAFVGVTQHRI